MWIYLQLLLLGLAMADDISPECKELYKANNPRPCCNTPSLFEREEYITECTTKCESTPDDTCCPLDCLIEASEIFVNGEINDEKVKELSLAVSQRLGESRTQWEPVTRRTHEECAQLIQSISQDVPASQCQSASLIPYLICTQQKNFINCPTFSKSESCAAVKTFVESQDKCGVKLADNYFLDGLFWRYFEPVAES